MGRNLTHQKQSLDTLSEQFSRFATSQCKGSSPLYEILSLEIAQSESLLGLCTDVRLGQPAPNMLLGAIHYLLLRGSEHTLKQFYPSIVREVNCVDDPRPHLHAFCNTHQDEIRSIVAGRNVQTHEVRRSACLLPALSRIADRAPLCHFIDIGACMGLHLLWDQYHYHYEEAGSYGDEGASVVIRCRVIGNIAIGNQLPTIASRVGIEKDPVDLNNPDECLWIQALIWPEHQDRLELYRRAVQNARHKPPRIVAGDAKTLLPTTIAHLTDQIPVVVFSSFADYQIFPNLQQLDELLAGLSKKHLIFRISIGHYGHKVPRVILATYVNAAFSEEPLFLCDTYGRWIKEIPQQDL